MISLTWLELANPYFNQAINSIFDCPMLDARTSYSAHRILKGIKHVEGEIKDLRMKLCGEFGKKDETGKLIKDESGFITFESIEKNREFEEAFTKEFNARKLELKVAKIDFMKVENVRGITPRMWEHLVPILENLPPEEDEPVLPEIPEGEPAENQSSP